MADSASDLHERAVANYLSQIPNVSAHKPKVSTKYSDVIVEYGGKQSWLEVKMNHSDQLGNNRVSFDGEKWVASKDAPITRFSLPFLNSHPSALQFVEDLKKFSKRSFIKIPTTYKGIRDPDAVPLEVMRAFFEDRTRYIFTEQNVDLGALVTDHYLNGKAEPAYYMQAGDDLYRIGDDNPLGLTQDLPLVSGYGDFKMRISTRSKFYEVQPEIKITNMATSPYSVHPQTSKQHPFNSVHSQVPNV